MRSGTRRSRWLLGSISCLLSITLPSAAFAESSGAAFLNIEPSARAFALGASNVTAVGAQALGANPANLSVLPRRYEVYTAYANQFSGATYGHAAVAISPDSFPLEVLGLAVTSLQTNGLEGADALGNATGNSFGAGDLAVSLGGAGRVGGDLSFGVAGKMISSHINGVQSKMSGAVDLGMSYVFAPRVSAGFSVDNLGPGIRFVGQTDPLPTAVNAGLSASFGPVLAVAGFNRFIHDKTTNVGVGGEYGLGPVAFRLGMGTQFGETNLALRAQNTAARYFSGLTLGLGVDMGFARLDYAVGQQAVDYGMTHRLGLTIQFGESRSPAKPVAYQYDPNRSDWSYVKLKSDEQ